MSASCVSQYVPGQFAAELLADSVEPLRQALGADPTLLLVFAAGMEPRELETYVAGLQELLAPTVMLGCTADSLISTGREHEGSQGVVLWAAHWPASRLTPLHLELLRAPEGPVIIGWPEDWRAPPCDDDFMIVLGEPFSFPTDRLLEQLAEDYADLPVVGGMAAQGFAPGANRLVLDGELLETGAVAVRIQGGVRMRSLVSQGCRPIGESYVITRAEQNEILELGGRPAMQVLGELFERLPTHEQRAAQSGLLVGRVIDEYQDNFQMGDFLVRGVVGVDRERRSVAVADFVRAGQTVQFHIRDETSADVELREMLAATSDEVTPCGGLLFSCNGRGSHMFEQSDHDAACVAARFGDLPLGGFFAGGEIGPVGGRAFLHGFTASLALFCEK